jgi:uncharacterized protein YccT (UPF0319 family)
MKKTSLALALGALVLSVPAFAQTHVQSAGGVAVSSGTGVVVTPGVPSGSATTATTVAVMPTATVPGAVVAQAGSNEVVTGNQRTVTTRYWVNVPAGVERDADFQRWQRLR